MKTVPHIFRRAIAGFTLIELLVVIAIIAILAAMLFPVIGVVKTKALIGQARTEMSNLGMAIKSYESDYNGRFPAPGILTGEQDVTYGYATNPAVAGQYVASTNANVMAVLLNLENFASGTVTTNNGHVFNPRNLTPLSVKMANDDTSGGLGPDGEYRDPWGKSYVISMDTSLNGRCRDNLYGRQNVSQITAGNRQGYNSLSSTNGTGDNYEFAGPYMIWSRGPDGQAAPGVKANFGVNKDNILGWQ